MENKFQPSFIPKRPATQSMVRENRAPFGFFAIVSAIIFLISLASTAGAFLYKTYVDRSLVAVTEEIDRVNREFQESLVLALERHNSRLSVAKELLTDHVAASEIFGFLEENTVANVMLTDFQFSALKEGVMNISVRGLGESFNSVALQSDRIAKLTEFESPVFTGLNLDSSGDVQFNFAAGVKPSALNYKSVIDRRARGAAAGLEDFLQDQTETNDSADNFGNTSTFDQENI